MTEKDNKVPKREAMSLSIWVCFDKEKKKKEPGEPFTCLCPGGPMSHYPSMGCSNMKRGVEKWQQKPRRRRRLQPSKHACKQGIYILQKSALQGGKCSQCVCQNSRTTCWVFMSYIRSKHISFVYTETHWNVRGSAFITLKKSSNWVLQWIRFPLLSTQINFKCLFT